MNTNKVAILIVSHNHGSQLKKLIHSLEKFNFQNVYFCDADSSDNSVEIIEGSKYKTHLLKKNQLESYSKNNNDLLRAFQINCQYYFLLNPDTYFEEDFLSPLLEIAGKDPKIGIVAPRVIYPDGRFQKNWKRFPNFFQVLQKRLGQRTIEDEPIIQPGEIDWCLGAAMLIKKELLKPHYTLLDERYRLYCEDIDICLQAKTMGLKVIGTSESTIIHELGESSSKSIFSKYNYWNISSILKFIFKWKNVYFKNL
jgi:N-acetylglucosaminyl-diphospho-decaprenol L-rhamnosyltransferase